MCDRIIRNCKSNLQIIINFPTYWLMKYTFKAYITNNENFDRYVLTPLWKHFTRNGRKARKIVKFFIETGVKFGHDTPIMHTHIEHSGLNIELAKGELSEILRETTFLSMKIFEDKTIHKIFLNKFTYMYR
ncbi:MAG: hypothetical protein Q9M43_12375 [Sulfurimonas sp.]|nr:hypothetical protein [Sulfurimonas sp.]